MQRCPEPQLASLAVIGTVGKSIQPSDSSSTILRYFELKTSVYEGKDNSTEYIIICLYPHTNRFKNTPCPNRHALVSVFGQVIGLYDSPRYLAVLVDDIVFLSTKGSSSQGFDKDNGSSSLTTMPKRKWDGWTHKNKKQKDLMVEKLDENISKNQDNQQQKSQVPDSPLTIISSPSDII